MPKPNQENSNPGEPGQQGEPLEQPNIENFEQWLEAHADDTARSLYDSHIEGLRNSVQATRQERDTLKSEIKDLMKTAEKGSQSEKALQDALDRLERAEKKNSFLEQAPQAQCNNPTAAYKIAVADNLFKRDGSPDWDSIKKEAPQLFGATTTNIGAGNGTDRQPEQPADMNSFIRRSAGR